MQYLQLNVLIDESNSSCPLEIIGFPCNQFGLQEPGENEYEILNGLKYVRPGHGYMPNFPLVEKRDVNGEKQDEIFTFLKVSTYIVLYRVKQLLITSQAVYQDGRGWGTTASNQYGN
jgi:glutathione peroxidase-family protein